MAEGYLSFLFKVVNFAVLVGVLVKYTRKPFKDYLIRRHQAVKEKLEEASRLIEEAEQAKQAYQARLSGLEAEIDAFRKSVTQEMEKEKKKILDEAADLAARIREQAHLAYSQETKEAMAQIRSEIAERTIKAAEQKVRDTFKKEDHDRMVEEFIEKVRSIA